MKKLLSIILAILMIVTSVPFAFASDIVASGECGADGNNLTWTLDSTGTLTISGEGAMAEYDLLDMPEYGFFRPPWESYKENIKAIVIEEGVTELGAFAFYKHTAVKDVNIADSVSDIKARGFGGCSAIEKLIIPAGISVLESTAFQDCSSLKQIVFLGQVSFNGSYSFNNCPELREIVFVKGATNIGARPNPFCLTDIKATEPIIHFGGTQAEAQDAFSGISQADRFYSVATIHYMDNCNCSVCGEYHIFEDGICEVCGKECNFTGEYETDENAHWSTCSDDDCNAIFKEYHSFENGICSVCEYECQHLSYVNGICKNCNYKCLHENYVEYKCAACGLDCTHENFIDNKCLDCGLSAKRIIIRMFDSYGDGWTGSNVIISRLLADGSFEEIGTVTLPGGYEGTYNLFINENDVFTVKWDKGSYADECTFEVLVDGETVFESKSCENYEDGEVVYIYCKHTFENGVCTICNYECTHKWSNKDGICANGCGITCPHESYTDGVCDNCEYACTHEWDEGVLTRPVYDAVLGSKDGDYTYTCTVCDYEKKETVKGADYSAYEAASEEINTLLQSDDLTPEAKQAIYSAANECGLLSNDLMESEQNKVDSLVAELEKILADAEEKIASGEYVKADYTEIDEAIKAVEDKLADENITDEGKAGLEEIKKQLEETKADGNTSKADLAELEKALGDYEAEIDKGIEDGTLVKFSGERVFLELAEEAEKKIDEKYGENAFYDFANENRDSFYNLYDKYFFRAASLEGGTMAENAENIEYIKGVVDELFGMAENCIAGTHNYGEGVLTRPTFETAGYYTYTCTLCGNSYTEPAKRADDTALNDASMKVTEYIDNDTLTQEAKDEIYKSYRDILKNNGNIFDELGFVRNDLVEEDQPAIDAITEELQNIIDKAEEKIASGEYVKIDGMKEYNKIADALDAELMENYSQEEFAALAEKAGDEINARFGEIIEKAEALTGTVAENKDALAEIESEMRALYGEIKNCLDGVHNGLVYEVTEKAKCGKNAIESASCTLCGETDEREVEGSALEHSFTKYEETEAPKCGVAGKEVAYCDHGCQTTDEREIPALEHIFVDYKSNGDATCEADGTKTASCIYGCGATDTVADEGTKLSHTDEDGDKLCDDCQAEIKDICPDCGRPVHEEKGVPQYICLIITLIRLVVSFVKAIAQK